MGLVNNLKHLQALVRSSRLNEWEKIRLVDIGSAGDNIRIIGLVDFGSEPYLIHLGSDVTLSSGVMFVNHDGGVGALRDRHPDLYIYEEITVGSRVFIGTRAIVLPGVSIGSNVVIGAGSIVSRDVPDGTVAAGNPCRPIRSIEEYEARALPRGIYWHGSPTGAQLKAQILAGVSARRNGSTDPVPRPRP